MPSEYLTDIFGLDGRVALVTGGSSGLGGAIAEALARAGAAVVLVARREEPLRAFAERLTRLGLRATWVAGDVGDRGDIGRVIDEATQPFGPLDILVNAAGVNVRPPFEQLTVEGWDETISVNLTGPYLLGRVLGPRMAQRGWGRIINVASQQTIRAFGNSGAYGVSKAGIAALTRSQAEAWSARGVCCNAIAPGFVHTPLTEAVFSDPERAKAMAARTMAGRNGRLEDLPGLAVLLAGPAAGYITGQTIFVDGGFSVF
jgi:gluconate 5-dehydrogenase